MVWNTVLSMIRLTSDDVIWEHVGLLIQKKNFFISIQITKTFCFYTTDLLNCYAWIMRLYPDTNREFCLERKASINHCASSKTRWAAWTNVVTYGDRRLRPCERKWTVDQFERFLSASLYFSKRGAYWDRLCRDVVGRWLVVTRVHCGQTVHPRPIVTSYGTLIGTHTPGIQWYKFRSPGVTPNRRMGPPWGAFCQITLTYC